MYHSSVDFVCPVISNLAFNVIKKEQLDYHFSIFIRIGYTTCIFLRLLPCTFVHSLRKVFITHKKKLKEKGTKKGFESCSIVSSVEHLEGKKHNILGTRAFC